MSSFEDENLTDVKDGAEGIKICFADSGHGDLLIDINSVRDLCSNHLCRKGRPQLIDIQFVDLQMLLNSISMSFAFAISSALLRTFCVSSSQNFG